VIIIVTDVDNLKYWRICLLFRGDT